MSQTIILKHSTVKDKLPSSAQYGEVFVNYHSENPFLATINNQGQFEKFLSENKLNELYYNKSQVNDIIGNLDDYYKKNEVDTLLQGKSDTGHTHDYSQILNTPDLSNLATLSDIPSINGLASEVWVGENYQPKGNYLTEHQSLENYYTKSEADNKFLTSHQDLSNYALKSEIPDTSSFVTSAYTDATYAKKGEAPTDVYTKSESDSKFQPQSGMTDYALKSEIPSTTGFASEEWVSNNFSSTAHTHSDLATKAELENYLTIVSASTTYATKSEIPDISDLATKSEIPDTSNFATKQELEDYQMKSGMSAYLLASEAQETYQPKGTYVVPSDLNNYVTSGYAEETFAKKGDVPTDVYTKSETDNLLSGKSDTNHTHDYSEIQNTPDLSGYASLSDIPKIWKGTLAEYTNLTEIDNDTLYIITDSSEQLVTSGDVESMISGYTNLTEVQTLLEGYSTTSHTHDYSEILNTPDLSGFASLSDIPDTSNFVTSAFTDATYAKKGEVPSDAYTKAETDTLLAGKANSAHTHTVSDITDLNIPSIEGLASEAWVSQNYQPVSGMSAYSTTAHTHSDLATKAELDDYLTIASASTIYATKEELEEFTPSDNYAGTVWTGTLSEYNNLTVIDTDTLYVITDANLQYVTSGQVESMISGYTNLTEVQTLLEGYSQTGHTHSQYLTQTSADSRYARVVSCTQAEYDALVQNDQVEQGVLYCIIEQSNS